MFGARTDADSLNIPLDDVQLSHDLEGDGLIIRTTVVTIRRQRLRKCDYLGPRRHCCELAAQRLKLVLALGGNIQLHAPLERLDTLSIHESVLHIVSLFTCRRVLCGLPQRLCIRVGPSYVRGSARLRDTLCTKPCDYGWHHPT